MDSQSHASRRHFLICPHCKTPRDRLPTHLKRVCMKKATDEERAATLTSAKAAATHLQKSGCVWDYNSLRAIMEAENHLTWMIEELEDRGQVIKNIPLAVSPATGERPAPPACSPPPPPPPCSAAEKSPGEEDGDTESSNELNEPHGKYNWTTSVRKMASSGLYQKHSLDNPLLVSFTDHFVKDLHYMNCKQEVENVARFLYYIDPSEASLGFVTKYTETRNFFRKLSESGQKNQTIQNYMKSLKRFVKFHTHKTDLFVRDQELHNQCRHYIDYLSSIQEGISPLVSKEVMKKRHEAFTNRTLTPEECLAVLEAAKKDFLCVIGKLMEERETSNKENLIVLYYLESILVLKHQQRPGVVENMTVSEWKLRGQTSGHCVVGVAERKTVATQVATFALDQEEELWFDLYFKEVRPEMLRGAEEHRSSGDDGDDTKFFISSTGKQIYNCSDDITAFQQKYNLPKVSSQMSRRAFETATSSFTDSQKSVFAAYFAHSNLTTLRNYRMRVIEKTCMGRKLIDFICGQSDCSGEERPTTSKQAASELAGRVNASTSREAGSELATQDQFLKMFPVTVDGSCPGKAKRIEVVGSSWERCVHDRWRTSQREMRTQHVLDHFSHRLPKERQVRSWMEKQGWTTNVPDARLFVLQWKPSGTVSTAAENKYVKKMVETQKWRGLLVMDIPGKGRGVLTTRPFSVGEVVCDYHGRMVSRKQGLKIHKGTTEAETGYMFFYKDSCGTPMCIDAHEEECGCHPGLQTFGRLINHSADRSNLRPRLFSVEGKDVLLFFAKREIVVDEELSFDYGVGKASFDGEGADLSWI